MRDGAMIEGARGRSRGATVAGAIVLAASVAFAAHAPARAQQTLPDPAVAVPTGPVSVADLAEGLLDAVVNISTSQNVTSGPRRSPRRNRPRSGSPFEEYFDEFFNEDGPSPRGRRVQSLGSGFVIDADEGIVITNNHVIAEADEVQVNFADGTELDAEVIGRDPKTDIAVLKVDPGDYELTEVAFGDSEIVRIGDWVLAIGNPFGLGGTVTLGIVSAQDRDINSGPYDKFIQTDAAINRGNSGGPLFNMRGEVIGINTAIISPTGGSIGIGFAVPSELAGNVIDQLREFGETRRGWLGVRIQPVTADIAESIGMDDATGALISGVIDDGPAKGSILPGDVILSFDGKPIEEMRDLPRVVADSPVGKAVDVEVVRKGERQTVQVTLGRLEDGEAAIDRSDDPGEKPVLGLSLEEIDDALREEYEIAEDVEGVVVTNVEQGSNASAKDVKPGDVIVEINQESIATPKEAAERIAELEEDGRKNALLMLASRSGELRFVTVRIE